MPKYEPVAIPDGSAVSTDPQHEALQMHIVDCDRCKAAIENSGRHLADRRIGARTQMCQEYIAILTYFATQ